MTPDEAHTAAETRRATHDEEHDHDREETPHATPDEERLARAALTRIVEPGDEHAGRWLRRYGAAGFLRRLRDPAADDHETHAHTDPTLPPHPSPSAARGSTRPPETGPFPGTGEKRVDGWRRRAAAVEPRRDLDAAERHGGRLVIPGDTEWPRQLDDLGDARPIGLWIRGPADLRTWALRSVAVVGARACTPYGAHTATTLASGLAERGWVVVSGAAFGIDGAAHRGALAAQGATVAVLACGVDIPYPRGHAGLIGRIAEQGLVVGELPPGSHPTPSRFILRNRVIAALTRGTVVVEAEYRSGSLVTARNAHRLGRHTMGIPGPVTSGLSAGVHELLRGEATLVTDAAEVIELVGDMGQLAPARRGPVLPRDLLDPHTTRVLEALPAGRPTPASEIADRAGTTPDDTLARLYELHSLGFVERQGDDWRLTNSHTEGANARRGGT
ncbi:DNA-processing protein DprA [Streptomyces sp. NBC_01353]|uniref:DNA-processing protein DprA n=1 Tax=Streptomyces sp. NBC_01353 TaxID=2903835 RepID=UPI002E326837|nr:DNA-processing protein DprA [Streptomyces sp. NBC_01353]